MKNLVELNQKEVGFVSGGSPIAVVSEYASEASTAVIYGAAAVFAFLVVSRKMYIGAKITKSDTVSTMIDFSGVVISYIAGSSFGRAAYRGNAEAKSRVGNAA